MLSDWIELCGSFNARGVEYLLVGGQAVVAHGYPRMTKDMDLWVRPSLENGERILSALIDFGAASDLTAKTFESRDTLLVLGREPFRVDILTDIPGVEFASAWRRRSSIELDGIKIPLISKADLIRNKRAVGRPQDLADVAALES